MKAGYIVCSSTYFKYDADEIIVCNYDGSNKVINYSWYGKSDKSCLEKPSIGK